MDKKYILEYDPLEEHSKEILDRVSTNVIRFRKEKGYSQLDLALAIGLKGAAYLGKAEKRTNDQHFNIKHIAKISKVLNIDIENFFKKT